MFSFGASFDIGYINEDADRVKIVRSKLEKMLFITDKFLDLKKEFEQKRYRFTIGVDNNIYTFVLIKRGGGDDKPSQMYGMRISCTSYPESPAYISNIIPGERVQELVSDTFEEAFDYVINALRKATDPQETTEQQK